jgi:hypothetical protein
MPTPRNTPHTPVFVDPTGHKRLRVRLLGMSIGLACAAGMLGLGLGLFGGAVGPEANPSTAQSLLTFLVHLAGRLL